MKGKRILVVLADYAPLITSNTVCLKAYIEGLELRGHYVDIFTRRMEEKDSYVERLPSGRTIYRIDDRRVITSRKWKAREVEYSSGIARIPIKMLSTMIRAWNYFACSIFSYEAYAEGWDIKEIRKAFQDISSKIHYDYILSVSFPEKTQQIAKMYVNEYDPNTRWLLLEFDPFCYNKSNYSRYQFTKLYAIQEDNYRKCYKVLLVPTIYNFYKRTPLWKYKEKMFRLEYAHLKPVSYNPDLINRSIRIDDSTISFLFCGTIKADVRPPLRVLEIFKYIKNATLYLMTGASLRKWDKNIRELGNRVILLGSQNLDTAYYCMSQADVLVNIGNTVEYQAPAKLYEYMSFGKPIVHFANIDNDGSREHVEKYPLGLYIDCNSNIIDAGGVVQEFINKKRNSNMSYESVIKAMPELAPEKIVSDLDILLRW